MERRKGFALIEVLLAMGLAAVISAAILVPMIYTADSLDRVQKGFGRSRDADLAVSKIFNDIRNSSGELPTPVIRTESKSGLAVKEDGRLTVWSSSPSNTGRPAGAVVYRIIKDAGGEQYGLYRWTPDPAEAGVSDARDDDRSLPCPAEIDTETLKREDGIPALKGVSGITFEANDGDGWRREYSGSLPRALRIRIKMEDREYVYEETLPFTE